MKNKIEINTNSLFCKIIKNLIYLFIGVFVIYCILPISFCFQFKFSIIQISAIILTIVFVEVCRRNNDFNLTIVNKVYTTFISLQQEPFIITELFNKILDFVLIVFFIYFVSTLFLCNSIPLTYKEHPIFEAIGIVITVSSIVLTVLFSTLQQFENKYSDFKSILQQWKTTNLYLFVMLAVYTVSSFIFYFIGSNKYFDRLILVLSIYLVLKLILIAINISFMMNFEILLNVYKKNVIKFLKSWNLDNDKNLINKIKQKGFRYFIKYKIFGINKKQNYTISEELIEDLQAQMEPIFRQAENFLRANNLNDFLICKKNIFNITKTYAMLYNNYNEKNFYQFLAAKIKDLFKLAVSLNYQSFPEYLVELNEQLGLCSIKEKKNKNDFYNNQTIAFDAFKNNAKEFVIMSINLENTPAPNLAIISYRKFIYKLIFNNSLSEVNVFIDDLGDLALIIWKLNNTKRVNNSSWCIVLISYIIIDIINTFYYIVMYDLTECMLIDTRYFKNKLKKTFENSFKLLTTYNTSTSDFSSFFINLGQDLNLKTITNLLNNSPDILTPYLNSAKRGFYLRTHYVNALNQVYNAVLVYDFDNNINFISAINCLSDFLELFVSSAKILFESKDKLCVNQILESLTTIQNYVFLFIKRIMTTNYQKKELLEVSYAFLNNLYSAFLNILKNYTISEVNQYLYVEPFVNFVYDSVRHYSRTNKKNKKIIDNLVQQIFDFFETLDNSKQESLYNGINFITLLLCSVDNKSEIFKKLCTFVINNKPEEEASSENMYIDIFEANNLPFFARHLVSNDEIKNYLTILAEQEENNKH